MLSGAPNEVWSYGEEVLGICSKYLHIREYLRPYTRDLMRQAHEKGTPVVRPLFYEFPADERAWKAEDQYMFGFKYLCAPVLQPKVTTRKVYLPKGKWKRFRGGQVDGEQLTGGDEVLEGGKDIDVDCPIDDIPVFVRED
jgi:alpha-D-xyloside xylohydrolase